MAITLGIDLHKTARAVNLAIAIFAISFLLAGIFFSFYLHFFTVTFIFLNLINAFYLYVQRRHTLLRNFGLLAQTRYFLESLGPEMRQYLFASDTEERPFNREERSEIYRKSLNLDSALAFGSTGQFDAHEIKIRHSMFPLWILAFVIFQMRVVNTFLELPEEGHRRDAHQREITWIEVNAEVR